MPTFSAIDNGTVSCLPTSRTMHIGVDKNYLRHSLQEPPPPRNPCQPRRETNPLLTARIETNVSRPHQRKYKIDPDVYEVSKSGSPERRYVILEALPAAQRWKTGPSSRTTTDTHGTHSFQSPKSTTMHADPEHGPCDDESWTWLNGNFLGETTRKQTRDYQGAPIVQVDKGRQDRWTTQHARRTRHDTYQGRHDPESRTSQSRPMAQSYYVKTRSPGRPI